MGSDAAFKLFQSDNGKNLLFKDSTKCLQEVQAGITYEQFLGNEYMNAMNSLRECSETTPGLYYCGLNLTGLSNLTDSLLKSIPVA